MAKKSEKTAGQRLDAAIETTKHHVRRTKEFVAHHAKNTKKRIAAMKEAKEEKRESRINVAPIVIGAIVLLVLLLILLWPSGGEQATTEQAASIARMLTADGVPFRAIAVERNGYVIHYAAEDAVGRFDDALLHDWGMIYGTAAAHECRRVSIVTSLAGEPLHRQTVECEAVRAFVRGLFTEEEFWLLVEHESLG